MERNSVQQRTAELTTGTIRRKRWHRVLAGLMSVVVFTTTYAMILPAITAEQATYCGHEEHTHSYEAGCYIEHKTAVCGQEEGEAHAHDETCYGEQAVLQCGKEETEGHVHGADCYTEQAVLTCVLPESEGHAHSDACYDEAGELICGAEESEGHTHSEACWGTEAVLTCGVEESEGHAHSDECYGTEQALLCDKPELTEGHVHTEDCFSVSYELNCEKEEHAHVQQCFSDPGADTETYEVWRNMFAGMELSTYWDKDLLAVAETQLGYAESQKNYEADEDGARRGYTRYGEWYGLPYGDWCAMFISFCLNYAGIPESAFPWESSVLRWVEKLDGKAMFRLTKADEDGRVRDDYAPVPGDLIFFDNNDDDIADHVGIVYKLAEDGSDIITVIEGNHDNNVAEYKYKLDDETILGYGVLPENPNPEEKAEPADRGTPEDAESPEDTDTPTDANAPTDTNDEGMVPAYAPGTVFETLTVGENGVLLTPEGDIAGYLYPVVPESEESPEGEEAPAPSVISDDPSVIPSDSEESPEGTDAPADADAPEASVSYPFVVGTGLSNITVAEDGSLTDSEGNVIGSVAMRLASVEEPENTDDVLTVVSQGVLITLTAPEGSLPYPVEELTLTAEPVKDEAAKALIENEVAPAEGENLRRRTLLFDIKIMRGDEEVQPTGEVFVTFSGMSIPNDDAQVFHVDPEAETVEEIEVTTEEDGSLTVPTEHFSFYGVTFTYTVEFLFGDYEFVLPGNSSIRLSELLEKLHIEVEMDEIAEVIFSDPSLIVIEKTEGEQDWILTAKMPFETEEELVVRFLNGQELVIRVTDSFQDANLVTTAGRESGIRITVVDWNVDSKNATTGQGYGLQDGACSTDASIRALTGLPENPRVPAGSNIYTWTLAQRTLSSGYPVVERSDSGNHSMAMLFGKNGKVTDSSSGGGVVSVWNATNTLYKYNSDTGVYSYSSGENACDFWGSSFYVRTYRERAYPGANDEYYGNVSDAAHTWDFLPFNYVGENGNLNVNTWPQWPANSGYRFNWLYSDTNMHFGMVTEFDFFMTEDGKYKGQDMVWEFAGDDVCWVFIDDVLVANAGFTQTKINFRTGAISTSALRTDNNPDHIVSPSTTLRKQFDAAKRTPVGGWRTGGQSFTYGSLHTVKIFYAETGAVRSTLDTQFNIPTIPSLLSVKKEIPAVVSADMTDTDFVFQLVDNSDVGLANVAYSVVNASGTVLANGTTDSTGKFSLKVNQTARISLSTGQTVKVKEITRPNTQTTSYSVNGAAAVTGTTTSAISTNNLQNTVVFTNTLKSKQVQFVKAENMNSTKLADAVFTLYTGSACTAAQATTMTGTSAATTGLVTINNVPYGTWYMKETTAPRGFSSNSTIYKVVVGSTVTITKADGTALPTLDGKPRIDNTVIKGKVVVKKQDENGNPMGGVKFSLTLTAGTCPAGTVSPFTGTTNATTGEITWNNVPYGQYKLHEEDPLPTGYSRAADQTFSVTAATTYTRTVKNTKANIWVGVRPRYRTITGTNAAGTANTYSGYADGDLGGTQSMTYNGTTVTWSNTDSQLWYKMVRRQVPYGTSVTFHNMEPKAGFIREQVAELKDSTSNADWTAIANNPASFVHSVTEASSYYVRAQYTPQLKTVKFTKTKPDGTPLQGAAFELRLNVSTNNAVTGSEYVRKATSGSNGVVEFKDIPLGTYTLVETAAPTGYSKRANETVTVAANDAAVRDLGNKPNSIPNVTVYIRPGYRTVTGVATNKTTPAWSSWTYNSGGGNIEMRYKPSGGSWSGWQAWSNSGLDSASYKGFAVPHGSEVEIRLSPATGYYPDQVYKNRSSSNQLYQDASNIVKLGTVTANTSVHVDYLPWRNNIQLTKVDSVTTATKLANVKFTLTLEGTSPGVTANSLEFEGTTNASGVLRFTNIPYGTYTLHEVAAPAGYTAAADQTITVAANSLPKDSNGRWTYASGTNHKTVTVGNIPNYDAGFSPRYRQFTGVSSDGKTGVLETAYRFGNTGGGIRQRHNSSGSWTGWVNWSVANADSQGYVWQTGITRGKSVQHGYMTAADGFVRVKAERKNAAGTVTAISVTSNGTGTAYTLNEKTWNDVYYDPVAAATVTLRKVDEDNNDAPMSGVQFTLKLKGTSPAVKTGSEGNIVFTGTTDAQGKITWSKVPYGTYTLHEVAPPTGYQAAPDQEIRVTSAAAVDLGDIPNSKTRVNIQIRAGVRYIDGLSGTVNSHWTDWLTDGKGGGISATPEGGAKVTWTSGNWKVLSLPLNSKVTIGDLSPKTGFYLRWLYLNNTSNIMTLAANNTYVHTVTGSGNFVADYLPIQNTITVTKVDAANSNTKLGGATLELRMTNKDGSNAYSGELADFVHSGVTNASGQLTFYNIPYGTYELWETEAPAGYTAPPAGGTKLSLVNASGSTVNTIQVRDMKRDASGKIELNTSNYGVPLVQTFTVTNEKSETALRIRPAHRQITGTSGSAGVLSGWIYKPDVGGGISATFNGATHTWTEAAASTAHPYWMTVTVPIDASVKFTVGPKAGFYLNNLRVGKTEGSATLASGKTVLSQVTNGSYTTVITEATDAIVDYVPITNTIEITKVEKGNTSKKLGGATFTLTRQDDAAYRTDAIAPSARTMVLTGTTGNGVGSATLGVLRFTNVPVGRYILKETGVPAGYEKAPDMEIIVAMNAANGATIKKTVEDNPILPVGIKRWFWRFTHVNDNGLSGEYDGALYWGSGAFSGTISMTVNGTTYVHATGEKDSYGMVTTEAAKGTRIDIGDVIPAEGYYWRNPYLYVFSDMTKQYYSGSNSSRYLDLTPNAEGKANFTLSQNAYVMAQYAPIRNTIHIVKVDGATLGSNGQITASTKKLAGAEFTLTLQGTSPAITGTGHQFHGTTDDNGELTFTNVPYGNWRLEETAAPDGYEPMQPRTIQVREMEKDANGRMTDTPVTQELLLSNTKEIRVGIKPGYQRITGVSGTDGKYATWHTLGGRGGGINMTVGGTDYPWDSLQNVNPKNYSYMTVSYGTVVPVTNLVPAKGFYRHAVYHRTINNGTEVSAGSDLTVDAQNKTSLTATLDGGDFAYVQYRPIVNTIKILKVEAGTLNAQGQPTANTKRIPNVKFTLTMTDKLGAEVTDLTPAQVKFTGTTDNNGELTFTNVPYGKYILHEEDPLPTGYERAADVEITVTEMGANNAAKTQNITVENAKKIYDLRFRPEYIVVNSVKDQKNGDFSDWNRGDLGGKISVTVNGVKTPWAAAQADAEGYVTVKVPHGTQVTIHDLTANEGFSRAQLAGDTHGVIYVNNSNTAYFTIEGNEDLSAYYTPIVNNVEIVKRDGAKTTTRLPGAEFTMTFQGTSPAVESGKEAQIVFTGTTGQDGRLLFRNVPYGTYKLVETKAPSGYATAPEKTVKVTRQNETTSEILLQTINVDDPKEGKLDLLLRDLDSKDPLGGVDYTLTNTKDPSKTFSGKTNATGSAIGHLVFPGLTPGETYRLTQGDPLFGYEKPDAAWLVAVDKTTGALTVTLDPDSVDKPPIEYENGVLNLYNWRSATELTITKIVTDESRGYFTVRVEIENNAFSGPVKTRRYDSEGQPISGGGEFTAENGKVSFQFELAHGQYIHIENVPIGATVTVTETTTDGYIVLMKPETGQQQITNVYTGTLNSDWKLQIINHPGAVLPHTGGAGTAALSAGGLGLMLTAAWLTLRRRKKRAEA